MLKSGYYDETAQLNAADVSVLCYGVPRSGSTFLWQLVRDVVGEGVVKTHAYFSLDVPTLCSIRDFRDCAVSHWRRLNPGCGVLTSDQVRVAGYHIASRLPVLERYCKRQATELLCYEQFVVDPSVIFDAVAWQLGIETPEARRQELVAAHAIPVNRRISESLSDCHDPVSLINPNHVHEGDVGVWTRFVAAEDRGLLTDILSPWLERYGYEL